LRTETEKQSEKQLGSMSLKLKELKDVFSILSSLSYFSLFWKGCVVLRDEVSVI